MLRLRLTVRAASASELARALERTEAIRHMTKAPAESTPDAFILSADLIPAGADEAMTVLEKFEIGPEDYLVTRAEVIAPSSASGRPVAAREGFAWIEIMGQARANSRPLARYLALMSVAGVIAALGVIKGNGILIVGAMAVSPDLLPICATCVGIVGARARLARRAFLTLWLGLVLIAAVAAALSALLNLAGLLPADFHIGQGGLAALAHTDYSTVLVALAAGVAAMLSFETRASAAVGVAISVTTIPASAYFGVGIGVGENGGGAFLVLVVNVALLILSGCATLAIQRRVGGSRHPRSPAP